MATEDPGQADAALPGAGPGNGTPEAGGLSVRGDLGFLRARDGGLRSAGVGVVAVGPPCGGPRQTTAVAAAGVTLEPLTPDVPAGTR